MASCNQWLLPADKHFDYQQMRLQIYDMEGTASTLPLLPSPRHNVLHAVQVSHPLRL